MLKPLWEPSQQRIKDTNMYRFMQGVNQTHGTNCTDYNALYQWSVENIEAFWAEMWRFAGTKASKEYQRVIDDPTRMPGAHWFTGSRLNFAENLLRYRDDKTALIFRGEDTVRRSLTYKELYAATAKVAAALRLPPTAISSKAQPLTVLPRFRKLSKKYRP
jgi:acetoacetyl-CoA synthetase